MSKSGLHLDRTDAMLTLLVIIWGSAFAGIKALGDVLDPYQMTWYRYLPFPILYGLWLVARRRETFKRVTGPDWIRMVVFGSLAVIGYHFPLNWSLHDSGNGVAITAATGAIIIATTPLWILVIATSTGKERPTGLAIAGSLLAFLGVIVVIFLGRGHVELSWAKKALVALIAPICWAVYSVYTKPLIGRYGGLFTTGVTMSLGVFVLIPLGISYGFAPLREFQLHHWVWLLFLALLSTVLGYAMWNQALKLRSASQVSVYIYFNPVVATLVAFIFLGERVTGWFVAGSALVMTGVILVNQARIAATRAAALGKP